jgi:DNA-binding MarR family transcriptional regulator
VHDCTYLKDIVGSTTMASDDSLRPRTPAPMRSTRPMTPRRAIARMFEADLSAPVVAAGIRTQNPRELSERVAMGRALWRELVVGFASQLGGLRLGFTQLAALYILADGRTTTISDLADTLNRSPSATSRLIDGLVRRRLVERRAEVEDRRQKTIWLTQRGRALLRLVDRGRADQFLSAVRPMPPAERALIAMGVAALATHAISRRGRLIKHSLG